MSVLTIAIIVAVVAIGALLAWRAVRFVIRLVLAGIISLAVAIGAFIWWRSAQISPPKEQRPAPRRAVLR